AALENARCTVQQLLLPIVDLVRMHPELTRQLGDRPVPSDRRQRHLRLEPRIMFLPCPLHVLLPRYPRVLGAGLHLSQLSHFRGPPQTSCQISSNNAREDDAVESPGSADTSHADGALLDLLKMEEIGADEWAG